MPFRSHPAPPHRHRRARERLLALGAVLGVHALLLSDAMPGLRAGATAVLPAARPPAVVRPRVVDVRAPAAPPMLVPSPATPPPMPPARPRSPPVAERPDAAPTVATAAALPVPLLRPTLTPPLSGHGLGAAVAEIDPSPVPAPAPQVGNMGPVAAAASTTHGVEPPVYPTRIPPPARLAYDLRRGALSGTGELQWRHDGRSYAIALTGAVLGLEVIGLASRGSFDAAGLAPERFVDRRRGRDRHAANFDRASGRILYSGPAVTYPLVPGAQDRLSWMVQLPAIVEADPARWVAGARVSIFVTGARGDADVWTFIVQGRETAELPAGRVAHTLRVTREPRKPYDTHAEAWLDPARHHLPVRARLTTLPGGETLELLLRE